jgi:hypothetical protein
MRAIDLLRREHRPLAALVVRWERAGRAAPRRRQRLMDEIVRASAAHISVQERVLYPALVDTGDGERLVERALHDHRLIERGLTTIHRADPDGEMEAAAEAVLRFIHRHLLHEESRVAPALDATMTGDRILQVARDLERAKRTAPTRPHPRVPRRLGMRAVADPMIGILDRTRDTLRGVRRSLLRGRRWILGGLDL